MSWILIICVQLVTIPLIQAAIVNSIVWHHGSAEPQGESELQRDSAENIRVEDRIRIGTRALAQITPCELEFLFKHPELCLKSLPLPKLHSILKSAKNKGTRIYLKETVSKGNNELCRF